MTLNEKPYWWDTAPDLPSYADRPLRPSADVVVIGGGYTGLSAARQLAKSSASVIVLEKETIGWGASSRNGGQVLTGLKVGVTTLVARYGLATATRLFSAAMKSIEYVAQLVEDESIDCGFTRCGNLDAASKPAHFEHFKKARDLLAREFDVGLELIPRDEQRCEVGSEAYFGVMVDPHSAALHPARYVRGLARAAERAGAVLHDKTPALRIERRRAGFAVTTTRGVIAADDVFVATNGYTDAVAPALRRRVIPIGSYIIATEPLSGDAAARLLPKRRVVSDSRNFLHYYRLSDDNRLIFGGRAEFVPSTADSSRRSAQILRRDMVQVFPQLRDVNVEYAWGGNVCFTQDLLPHAGQMPDGVHFAMGYGGHGVAMATYLGAKMADVMLGKDDQNPFRGMPFRAIPLYNGRPWFLPFAALYYRFLDWIG